MITKFPYKVAPAFNELIVEDDANASLEVSEIGGKNRAVTLHHVLRDGVARFDLKTFVSKLFYDVAEPVQTTNVPGWVFKDHRLQVRYSAGGYEAMALNAVRDKGHSLDLLDVGDSGALTLRPASNNSIEIPKYEGFPCGVTLMHKNMYAIDTSNATIAVVEITAVGTAITLPWYYGGDTGGFILWGDGSVDEMTAVSTGDLMQHIYMSPGTYELMWIPTATTKQYISAPGAVPGATAFAAAVRSYTQISNTAVSFSAYGCAGLQRMDCRLPQGLSLTPNIFRECASLRYIDPGFFATARSTVTNLAYAFYNTVSLTNLADNMFSGMSAVTTMAYCFYGSGIATFKASMFTGMAKVADCSYAFAQSKIVTVPDGMCADMVALNNASYMFMDCRDLTSVGMDAFKSNASQVNATGVFYECGALTDVSGSVFKGLTGMDNAQRAFSRCISLKTIPVELFAFNTKLTNVSTCFDSCKGIMAIPANLFLNNMALEDVTYCFQYCSGLITLPGGLFANNTKITNVIGCFQYCTTLTSIPSDLFSNLSNLTSVRYCFTGCSTVSNIPSALFANNAKLTNVGYCFADCFKVSAIPGLLFVNNAKITDVSYCFYACQNVASIPGDLFKYNPEIQNISNCFRYCPVVSISANLFANTPEITDASSCFAVDMVTTSTIPGALFDACAKLTNVSYIFSGRAGVTSVGNIFSKCPLITNFSGAFSIVQGSGSLTGVSPVTSEGYKLWERAGKPGYPGAIAGTQCFRNNYASLTDSTSVPTAWK